VPEKDPDENADAGVACTTTMPPRYCSRNQSVPSRALVRPVGDEPMLGPA
jgi:hypothetical protein